MLEMNDLKTLGCALQALRQNLGWSREKLAEKLKMPVSAVAKHEAGRRAPSVDELQRYLRTLRSTLEEFDRLRAHLAACRGRTEQWWVKVDMTAPEDRFDELGAQLGKLMRLYAAEMVRKVDSHR
jgi:transcriptional regulator with XRE-family HTH domain